MPLTLTEKAAEEFKKKMEKAGKLEHYLRVYIKGGGCAGYTYEMRFDKEKEKYDNSYNQHGIKLIYDPKSAIFLEEVTIDFDDTNLLQRRFVFNNPKAKEKCSCGLSFS